MVHEPESSGQGCAAVSLTATMDNSRESERTVILRASALLFVFRALAAAQAQKHQETFERQILDLISELVPCDGGAIVLDRHETELRLRARERSPELETVVTGALAEQAMIDNQRLWIAVPLYAGSSMEGVIALHFPPEEAAQLEEHYEIISAIASIACSALENAREMQALERENELLHEQIGDDSTGIVGRSPSIQKLLRMIERVAPQEATVLILGESGTGKELVARAIHRKSSRHARPFVAINCAALSETLLESELFGHEKGAFTGAVALKKGKLEMAEGGTVFLDEIGELAPGLQAKLLRVLQQREFERVGGTRLLRLNVRLVAATNRDLAAEVARGSFREDLYHRLDVVRLTTPPLREIKGDIPGLARHFLAKATARCGRRVNGFSSEAEELLLGYAWPGNVRELENAVERSVVLGESNWVLPEDLPEAIHAGQTNGGENRAYQSTLAVAKRQSIVKAWEQSGGDYKAAARLLGIHPNSLLRLIRNLGLREGL